MLKITDKKFYEENPTMYDVLTDYIAENPTVDLLGVTPACPVNVDYNDCYLDDNGDFFKPNFYNWIYKGSDPTDDPDEYAPVYDHSTPTLTKLEIANMITQVEEPDLNNPANNTN